MAKDPIRKSVPVQGMWRISPPNCLDVAYAGCMQHRTRAQKEQSLEKRMIQHMQQSAAESQNRQNRLIQSQSQHAQSQPQGDDADILHAVIGQQPL